MATTTTFPASQHMLKATKPLTTEDARSYGVQSGRITVTAHLSYHRGNARPHFSITADVRGGGRELSGGCLHDDIRKYWPDLAPVIALHLSDDTGQPMHALANGWYWLAGSLGGLGERYHGGNGTPERTPDECLQIFADHIRVSWENASEIRNTVRTKSDLATAMLGMVDRWITEAEAGIALLDSLRTNQGDR